MKRPISESKKKIPNFDLSQEIDYYHPKPKKPATQKYVIAVVLIVLAGAAFLFSPYFAVHNIRAENASKYTTTELCDKIGLQAGDNAILFNRRKAEDILRQDPYIRDARLILELPDTIVISLQERKVRAYIPYMGSYLYIDEEGRVLDVQSSYVNGLPLIKGLVFSGFHKGEILEVEEPKALNTILQISQMIEKYDLSDFAVTIDVSDLNEITASVNQIQVQLGNMENMDQKIRNMAQIVQTIPENDRGTLDLHDLSDMRFEYLT